MSDLNQNDSNAPDIKSMLAEMNSTKNLSPEKSDLFLDAFEKYECWTPFFKILTEKLQTKTGHTEANYIRLAKVQSLYLEDVFAAAETCSKLVKSLPVSYDRFHQELIPQIVEKEDYIAEATILQAASTEFSEKHDHISCLERLCMLYEKKTYNETQLAATYEKLLDKDRKNIKALRYFKLVYTQNQDWENVANLLQDLMKSLNHKQEKYRVAQELAAVLLYHLDQPEDTIKIIRTCCVDSPLDTSTIEYEAFCRLKDWKSCLDVLKARLAVESTDERRAVYCAKIAEAYIELEDSKSASLYFEKSAQHKDDFFDPIESLIAINTDSGNWPNVIKWLKFLKKKAMDPDHIDRVDQVIKRIEGALEDAAPQN